MVTRDIPYIQKKFEGKSLEEKRKLFYQWVKEGSFSSREFWAVIETFFQEPKQ